MLHNILSFSRVMIGSNILFRSNFDLNHLHLILSYLIWNKFTTEYIHPHNENWINFFCHIMFKYKPSLTVRFLGLYFILNESRMPKFSKISTYQVQSQIFLRDLCQSNFFFRKQSNNKVRKCRV